MNDVHFLKNKNIFEISSYNIFVYLSRVIAPLNIDICMWYIKHNVLYN